MPNNNPTSLKDTLTEHSEPSQAAHEFASHVIQCGHCRSFPHDLCSIGQSLLAKVEWEHKCAEFAAER